MSVCSPWWSFSSLWLPGSNSGPLIFKANTQTLSIQTMSKLQVNTLNPCLAEPQDSSGKKTQHMRAVDSSDTLFFWKCSWWDVNQRWADHSGRSAVRLPGRVAHHHHLCLGQVRPAVRPPVSIHHHRDIQRLIHTWLTLFPSIRIHQRKNEGATYSPRQAEIIETKCKLDQLIAVADMELKDDKVNR